jgi:hypothetical protein
VTVKEISSKRRIFLVREKKVPGGTNAHVAVAIAVPVVDVEAVLVEVADTRNVVSVDRKERIMPISIYVTGDLGLPLKRVYILFLLNFIREHPFLKTEPPLKTGKKFNLNFLSHTTVIRKRRYSGDSSRLRRGFGGQAKEEVSAR